MTEKLRSSKLTEGILVEVAAKFLPRESNPDDDHFFFSYRVTLRNEGENQAKLLARHWIIINSDGERHEVRGPGVVGETPVLESGEQFEYTSFCPLDTHWGTMEGTYLMERQDGSPFVVDIARFLLIADIPRPSLSV